jgi:hypothetical protein
MNRIIKVAVDDIILDPAAQSEMLTNAALERNPEMAVTGVCEINDTILVVLEEGECEASLDYVFAPFNSLNEDEIVSEISQRYFSGFTLVGGFDVKKTKWALFSKRKNIK